MVMKNLTVLVIAMFLFNIAIAQTYTALKVTEIMYNAPDYNGIAGASLDFWN